VKPNFFGKENLRNEIKILQDKKIPPEQVQRVYLSVGWQFRETEAIKKSLEKSLVVISAWHNDKLVGIARATGDGVFNATIWDMAVRKDYQNKGIGKLIMKSMLTKLDDCGIPLITLYTEYANRNFYSKLDFEMNIDRVAGMFRYKK